jgi:hypothetical protein
MERKSRALDPVVIGQDDQTELHVQAVIQGGRRHLDIRVWRRGPTGFAPSRNALTLDAPDLDALQEGIAELLEASDGGRQVARVVWDKDEGRRLRAETEPFGAHFLARLGFWQRVRDSWKPAGEGLVLSADRLRPLQALLRDIRPRLEPDVVTVAGPPESETEQEEDSRQSWPPLGADWITIQPGRVAFHPRGFRLTAEVAEDDREAHALIFRQWKREDGLWLTNDENLRLSLIELDGVLAYVRSLIELPTEANDPTGEQIRTTAGATVWVRLIPAEGGSDLCLDERPPCDDGTEMSFERRLHVPATHLPRFGRMLWQSRVALIAHLSKDERDALLSAEDLKEVVESAQALAVDSGAEVSPNRDDSGSGPLKNESREQERVVLEEARMIAWKPDPRPRQSDQPEQPDAPWAVSMGDLKLGHFHVFLFLQDAEPRSLTMQWEGRSLQLPADHLEDFMARVRDLYYDALRGRRGRAVTIGTRPAVTVSVHHHGTTTFLALDQEIEGKTTHLSFPTQQVPAFLNVAETALANI